MERPPHAALADRYRAEPERAAVTQRVRTELREGMRCETTSRGHVAVADEPRSLGGTDTAQSPVELFLTSIATCHAATYRMWADELGVALDRVTVEVEGDIDLRGYLGLSDEVPPGYGAIRITVGLEGPEPEERYRRLAEEAERRCPLLDALERPIPVSRVVTTG
ncbi:MAG TPA: OsmC family protein [Miltoncostaeaceae bacterium]|jgi:uncharacterized OsmC-like protein|nr:OsmC family protein [Miltoncostaeaceae bacterium]